MRVSDAFPRLRFLVVAGAAKTGSARRQPGGSGSPCGAVRRGNHNLGIGAGEDHWKSLGPSAIRRPPFSVMLTGRRQRRPNTRDGARPPGGGNGAGSGGIHLGKDRLRFGISWVGGCRVSACARLSPQDPERALFLGPRADDWEDIDDRPRRHESPGPARQPAMKTGGALRLADHPHTLPAPGPAWAKNGVGYDCGHRIGVGGMAEVYRAVDTALAAASLRSRCCRLRRIASVADKSVVSSSQEARRSPA